MTLLLYPNPTTGLLQWDTEGIQQVRVFNPLGGLVLDKAITGKQIDLGHLSNGIYQIQLLGQDGQVRSTQSIAILR